jgi:hypothetical protein
MLWENRSFLLRLVWLIWLSSTLSNPPPDLPGSNPGPRKHSKRCPYCETKCAADDDGSYYCIVCDEYFA